MKITIIHGQSHCGCSYQISHLLIKKLQVDTEDINEIFLPRDMPEFCNGCTTCIYKNEKYCPHYQYMDAITKQIDAADLLIFTTPVYVFHATGSLIALLDHYGYRWMTHRPEELMFSKQAVCISTAAGAGMKSAIKDIKHSLFFWGIARIYSYGVAVAAVSWNEVKNKKKVKIEKKMSKLARQIKNRQNSIKPSLKTKVLFLIMRAMQTKGWNPTDSNYWKEKGWIKKERPWKNV